MSMDTQKTHIRWMIKRDMEQVMRIEASSFREPWTRADFERRMHNRHVIAKVIATDDNIVGYLVYELHRHYVQILNLAVDPYRRLQGIGRRLIDDQKTKIRQDTLRRCLWADVFGNNIPAQQFLNACGFACAEIWEDAWCYDDGTEDDVYRFVYSLEA